ncbi:MAG: helix-turn-helix transcriptional regulator [Acidobacteria bacterium]|nr:helix-turn-helix transcriptional regulator [Acidobacteriota bacterium]
MDVLTQMGPVLVSELASVLGRPADALYYHLRTLTQAGLVHESRCRGPKGREAALFRAVGTDLRIDYEALRGHNANALGNVISSMMRLGIRDFRKALCNEKITVSGQERELWALRRVGWLTKDDLKAVVKSMEKLADSVAQPSGKGQLYGITILLTPLKRRRARTQLTSCRTK